MAHRENIRRTLLRLKELGIIAMPLDIDMTAELHARLFFGAEYNLASNRDAAKASIMEALRKGLSITVGLIEDMVALHD